MMGADMTVAITRTEHTAADRHRLAAGSNDASMARRLLALALILDSHKRADAVRLAGMDCIQPSRSTQRNPRWLVPLSTA